MDGSEKWQDRKLTDGGAAARCIDEGWAIQYRQCFDLLFCRETMRVLLDSAYSLLWFFAPFTTVNSSKAPVERSTQLRGDMNFIALPEGIANVWDLPQITDHNAPWPSALAAFGYMMRYGFEVSAPSRS